MILYLVMEQFYKGMEPIVSSNEVFLSQEEAEKEVDRLLKYWDGEYAAWVWKFERVEK